LLNHSKCAGFVNKIAINNRGIGQSIPYLFWENTFYQIQKINHVPFEDLPEDSRI
jgi:hypothetical protein